MRRRSSAVIAFLLIFGIGTLTGRPERPFTSTDVVAVVACQGDQPIVVGYGTSFHRAKPGFRVDDVTVRDIHSECAGADISVTLLEDATELATSTAKIDDSTIVLALDPQPPARDITRVWLSIEGDDVVLPPPPPPGTPAPTATIPPTLPTIPSPGASASPSAPVAVPPVPGPCRGHAFSGVKIGTEEDDMLRGARGPDLILGLRGADLAIGRSGSDCLVGGRGTDELRGGRGADIVLGGRGVDHLRGGRGNDLLRGGRGNDVLRGGPGNDVVRGGPGKDVVRGGPGNDVLFGGWGRNHLSGGTGFDTCHVTEGKDTYRNCNRVIFR